GVAFSVAWIEAPRALVAGCYIAIGWVAVVALPQLSGRLGLGPVLLILAGGVLYSLGALAYALQRPNPWPRWFGYHEVFHGLVIAAAVLHFVAIAEVVLRPVSAHA
ncbi:MAG: hemolysin III, partial [Actinobacteria bacterium]